MTDNSPLTDAQKQQVAERWGREPDTVIDTWGTVPHVNRRAAELIGADPVKGFWGHMLDLYSDPDRPLDRVLSLACGHGHQERTLARCRTFRACDAFDISEAALASARRIAEAEGLHQINYECRDLNELRLTHTYDAVIAAGVHHVSNLEGLFAEVSRALAPGGFFLMYEYIGPSQGQPTARQVEAINACIRLLPTKYRVRVSAQRKLGVSSPEDALALLGARHLGELERHMREAADRLDFERAAQIRDRIQSLKEVRDTAGAQLIDAALGASTVTPVSPPQALEAERRQRNLLVRAAVAAWKGEFGYRLKRFLVYRLGGRVDPEPSVVQPAANVGPVQSQASDELFWTTFTPMTREQWNATDPSESIRSDEIIPLLRKHFRTVDVRYTGGSILQFTLYDIAGNFGEDTEETRDLLDMLFKIEDVLVKHDDVPQNYAVIVAKNA